MLCAAGHHNRAGIATCSACGLPLADAPRRRITEKLTITLDDVQLARAARPSVTPAPPAALPLTGNGPGPSGTPAGATVRSTEVPPAPGAPQQPAPSRPGPEAGRVRVGQMPPGSTFEVELVAAPALGQAWRAASVDVWVSADHTNVAPSVGEVVRERFRYVGGAWGTGLDPQAGPDLDGRLRPLYEGGGQLAVTDRRIIGFSRAGSALGHAVGPHLGLLVCWQLPLSAVGEVALATRSRPGGGQTTGLDVWVLGSRPALLRLDEMVGEDTTANHLEPARRAMQTVVRAAADLQAPTLTDAQRAEVLHPEQVRWFDPAYSATAEWLRGAALAAQAADAGHP